MSLITALKKAALAVAKDRELKVPDGFNVDSPGLGEPARALLRRVAASHPAKEWTPASVMLWLYKTAHGKMTYTQGVNRMEGVNEKIEPPDWPKRADCSSLATWAYWVSDRPDPNGRGYDGQGYTGTLDDHGKVVRLSDAESSDLVFYSNPDHVAVYVGNGRVVGFGHQGGPDLDPVGYRLVHEVRRYPK